jgi:DNA-binding transcriptional ArsR family regulator
MEERLNKLELAVQEILDRLEGKRGPPERIAPDLSKQPIDVYAKVLKGLSNPIRIALLSRIAEGGKYNNELAEITGLGPASLNFHLTELRSGGLISQETSRGKYVATELGLEVLSMMTRLTKLSNYETVETDRFCWLCSKAQFKVDIYPTYFQGWCPSCGGEHGSKWTMTGFNRYGEDWRHHNLDDFLDEGWALAEELLKESIKEGKCNNCGARMEYVRDDYSIHGECPSCESYNHWSIHNVDSKALLIYWRKYKKIKHIVKGPIKRKGVDCWEASLETADGNHLITQFRELKTGRIIDESA